jgi:hypothetical protein
MAGQGPGHVNRRNDRKIFGEIKKIEGNCVAGREPYVIIAID